MADYPLDDASNDRRTVLLVVQLFLDWLVPDRELQALYRSCCLMASTCSPVFVLLRDDVHRLICLNDLVEQPFVLELQMGTRLTEFLFSTNESQDLASRIIGLLSLEHQKVRADRN